jgi:hypothetical protein
MLVGDATVLAMMKRIAKRIPVPWGIAKEIREDWRWLQKMT